MLDRITALDIEEYMEYLRAYRDSDGRYVTNGEKGLKRKMSALRSFYAYYYKHELIQTNPTLLVDMPKLHQKAIVRLEADEVARLLDYMEQCGNSLTGQKKAYYERPKSATSPLLRCFSEPGSGYLSVWDWIWRM